MPQSSERLTVKGMMAVILKNDVHHSETNVSVFKLIFQRQLMITFIKERCNKGQYHFFM